MALSTSFAVIFLFSLWTSCMTETMGTNEYSQTNKEETTRDDPAKMYSSLASKNERLLRHTKEVVTMNSLPRIDPVKIGYTRKINIFHGQTHQIKTLSIDPPIFEVEHFLTDEDCQLIIDLATETGFEESKVVRAYENRQTVPEILKLFKEKDADFDKRLNETEMAEFFLSIKNICLGEGDLEELLRDVQIDKDEDGMISEEEIFSMVEENYEQFYEYLENIETTKPERKVRHSDTVFLAPSVSINFFDNMRYRLTNVTGLPYAMIRASEYLQVVKYNPSGHYHTHLDSERLIKKSAGDCCQFQDWVAGCTLCRYMTVLYFLNDVEEGGETAFPFADNVTCDSKILHGVERHRLDLARHCYDANLYYKPKKGTALMWYNHKLNSENGWFGELDIRSYHGGCNVIKGSKWIANNWIDASPDNQRDIDSWIYYLFNSE